MPSVQRGQVYRKPSGTWAYRHHDADGRRREVAKFRTKSEASEALRDALDDVRLGSSRRREVSFAELVDRFLAAHEADDLTLTKLAAQLRRAKTDLGERPIADLRPDELAAWRRSLPANRHHQFRAVAQVLNQAVRWEWIDKSPARHIANPKPKAPEIQPFTELGRDRGDRGGDGFALRRHPALRRRDRPSARGVDRARAPRRRLERRRSSCSPRLHARAAEGMREVIEAAAARTSSTPRGRSARRDPAPARLAAPLPGCAWRAYRVGEVSRPPLGARPQCGGSRASPDLRLPTHLRGRGASRRASHSST